MFGVRTSSAYAIHAGAWIAKTAAKPMSRNAEYPCLDEIRMDESCSRLWGNEDCIGVSRSGKRVGGNIWPHGMSSRTLFK